MVKKYLSYMITSSTPSYGNRNHLELVKNGDSRISTTLHLGTHIDFPFHFFENGQTIKDFDLDFWFFEKPLFIEIEPRDFLIYDEVIEKLEKIKNRDYDILIVKTGICDIRESEDFWKKNYGFSADLYDYLIKNFPNIRVFGFDSISISSWQNRPAGREAHKRFLNPEQPILILEDMDLRNIKNIQSVEIHPIRIENADGSFCTVIGEIEN